MRSIARPCRPEINGSSTVPRRLVGFLIDPRGGLLLVWMALFLLSTLLGEFVFLIFFFGTAGLAIGLFLLLAFLVPTPKPLSASHALVGRLNQILRSTVSSVVLLLGAFLGALVATSIESANGLSLYTELTDVWDQFFWIVAGLAFFGALWLSMLGSFFDLWRTGPILRQAKINEALDFCAELGLTFVASGTSFRSWAFAVWNALTCGWMSLVAAFMVVPVAVLLVGLLLTV